MFLMLVAELRFTKGYSSNENALITYASSKLS